MNRIIEVLSNPFIWGPAIFIAGIFLKKKRDVYLKLLFLLVEAIEIIDDEVRDIVPDALRGKLTKIKERIARKTSKSEGKVLDGVLKKKGYLSKHTVLR